MTFSAALLGVTKSGIIIPDPSPADAKAMASLHVLAFSSKGHLLLNESQGRFEFDTWEAVRQKALDICQNAAVSGDGDVSMGEGADSAQLHGFVRETAVDQVHRDYAWKIDAV
jgi:exosome complex component RRP46